MNDISTSNAVNSLENSSRLNLPVQTDPNLQSTMQNGLNSTNNNVTTNENNPNQPLSNTSTAQSTALVPANNINQSRYGMGGMGGGYGMGGMGGGYGMGGMGGGYGMGGMGGGMGGMGGGQGMQPQDPNRPRGFRDDFGGTMQGLQSLMQIMSAGVGMYSFGGMFVKMTYNLLSSIFGKVKSGFIALFVNRVTLSVAKGMTTVASKAVESGDKGFAATSLIKYSVKCLSAISMASAIAMYFMKKHNDFNENENYLIKKIVENQQIHEKETEEKRIRDLSEMKTFSESMRGLDIDYTEIAKKQEDSKQKLNDLETAWADQGDTSETNSIKEEKQSELQENLWKESEETEKNNESLENNKENNEVIEGDKTSEEKSEEKSSKKLEQVDEDLDEDTKSQIFESESDKKSIESQKSELETELIDKQETIQSNNTKVDNEEPENMENPGLVKNQDSIKNSYKDFLSSVNPNVGNPLDENDTAKTSEEFGVSEKMKEKLNDEREQAEKKEEESKKKRKQELEEWTSKIMMRWPDKKTENKEEKVELNENSLEKDIKNDENNEIQNNNELNIIKTNNEILNNQDEKPIEQLAPKPVVQNVPKPKPWLRKIQSATVKDIKKDESNEKQNITETPVTKNNTETPVTKNNSEIKNNPEEKPAEQPAPEQLLTKIQSSPN